MGHKKKFRGLNDGLLYFIASRIANLGVLCKETQLLEAGKKAEN